MNSGGRRGPARDVVGVAVGGPGGGGGVTLSLSLGIGRDPGGAGGGGGGPPTDGVIPPDALALAWALKRYECAAANAALAGKFGPP